MTQIANVEARRADLLQRRLRGRGGRTGGIARIDRGAPLPMSFGQEQMWFLDQLTPDSVEYLVPFALRLRGELDRTALSQAWDSLVSRHEILRTRHVLHDGRPCQVVDEPVTGRMSMVTLADVPPQRREQRVAELIAAESATPIGLAHQWPARAALVQITDVEHVLLVVFHHIACDAWSSRQALAELGAFYTATREGAAAVLPSLPVQYADFAAWQRAELTPEINERQLAYWRDTLSGAPRLDLPTDHPRPPVRGYAGAEVDFVLPPELGAAVAGLARARGATPFVVLMAAFQALLARYTGRADVPVGTVLSSRTRPELQHLVGNGINTLVIRTHSAPDVTFRELLGNVKQTVLDAFDHSAVPFSQVVDKVQPGRELSSTPLFQAVFTWHESVGAPPDLIAGLEVEPVTAGGGVARCDLELQVAPGVGGELRARLIYATDLFEASTVERMAAHLTRLLAGALGDLDAPLSAIDLLDDEERARLTAPAEPMSDAEDALRRFDRQVAAAPEAVAVITDDGETTFAELSEQVNRIMRQLRAAGVRREEVVAILLDRGVDLLASMLAIWRVGAAYLPIGPELPRSQWGRLLSESAARLLVTCQDSDRLAKVAEVFDGHVLALQPGQGEPVGPEIFEPGVVDLDALAYVVYTSGSTGRPKGVATTHRGLINHLNWVIDSYIGDRTGGAPLFSTVAGDVVVPTLFAPLLAGQPVHMFPQELDMSELGARLAAAKPFAFVKLTPGHLEMLSHQLEPDEVDGLAGTVVTGGDALLSHVARRWDDWLGDGQLVNEYGPTEITVGNSTYVPGSTSRHEVVPIGYPIPHTSMYVLDESLRPTPVGVIGEVCVGGVGVARGYLNQPAQTGEKFVPDPFGSPGARLYRTGDLGRVLPDGNVEFVGRADNQVKIRGYRVELGEIENVLTGHQDVDECRVVLRSDGDQRRLVGYVVGAAVDLGQVKAWLAERLPEHMVPTIVVLERIPLTANGKLDVPALPELTGPVAEFVAPRNSVEDRFAQLWATTLRVERVGVHDGFFDLGGDSIRAVALVGAMRQVGYDVTVADVFGHATVAKLAELVSGRDRAEAERTVEPFALIGEADRAALPDGVVDAYPLSRNQTGMLFEMLADDDKPYHCITTFWVRDGEPFSPDAMTRALKLLTERHEALRTSLHLSGYSTPMQLVHAEAEFSFGTRDLRGMTSEEVDQVLKEYATEERATLFDFEQPGLKRFHVFTTDHGGHWLAITECHPIQEGWGYHTMVMELINCYNRLRHDEQPTPYEPPAVRFADFVAEELAALKSEEHADYWRGTVSDYAPLTLPEEWGDRTAEAAKHQAFADWRDLKPRLRDMASAAEVSMKCVMVAAFTKVLAQFTDEEAFHFGLITDARPERIGADTVYGMYLNTLPFAVRRPTRTWRDLLRATFDREVQMWAHRRFPYPEIVRMADKRRRLIDVIFNYHDFNQVDTNLVGERMGLDESPTDFGLSVSTRADMVLVTADYRMLGPEQADLIAKMFRLTLEAMAEDLDGDASVALFPEGRRRWLLHSAHTAARPAGRARTVSHALEAFEQQVARTPSATAVRCGGDTLTFTELDERASRLGRRLQTGGFGRGSVAGVVARRDIDLLVSLLATWKAGGAYVPLDPAAPADRWAYVLDNSGAQCVLVASDLADRMPRSFAVPTVLVDGVSLTAPDQPRTSPQSVTCDGLAYVIYTSGSTGRPKGVQVSHANLANYLSWVIADYAAVGDGGAPLLSTVASDLAVTALFGPLLLGQPVHVLPDDLDLSELGEALLAGGPYSFLKLTPGHLEVLAQQLDEPVAATMVVGGEPLHGPIAQRWVAMLGDGRVINEYGLTETTVGNSVQVVRDDKRPLAPIGNPVPNTSMHVLDERLQLVPQGVVGEVCVGGEGLSWGYANRAALTAERFVPNPYGPPGSRLYRTGDLGRVLRNGSVDLIGRRDGQVKIRGYRVELGEIETVLGEHPLVAEARVLLRTTTSGDRRLVAYVVSQHSDDPAEADQLRPWIATFLPDYMAPSAFVRLEQIPLTANGKLDTAALPALDGAETGGVHVPPKGPLEELVAETWSQVLGRRVGADDMFVDLGGDSIRAVALTGALRNAGLKVSVRELFAHPTVGRLSRLLADRLPDDQR